MILYKAIKYTILDICLNTIISGIIKNSGLSKKLLHEELYIGTVLSKISCVGKSGRGMSLEWEYCKIVEITVNRFGHKRIKFSFKKTNAPFAYAIDDNDTNYDAVIITDESKIDFIQ